MGLVARQFGGPSGLAGRLVTRLLARGNAGFNSWVVAELAATVPAPASVVEIGCGPGIALGELVKAYPTARIVGIDQSRVVLNSARRRNAEAIAAGRLSLEQGGVQAAARHAPADLVLAVHVLYFWPDPVDQLRQVSGVLAEAGRVALGYQLRPNMPPKSQRDFPKEGFTLYDSDEEVGHVLERAGFRRRGVRIFGDPDRPGGRLVVAARG